MPEADDAELFCKEASEFALPAVQEDRNTAVINAVAVIENKNRFFLILIPFWYLPDIYSNAVPCFR